MVKKGQRQREGDREIERESEREWKRVREIESEGDWERVRERDGNRERKRNRFMVFTMTFPIFPLNQI